MDQDVRPDVTELTREELKRYGGLGRREDLEVCLELIRRHRQTSKWRFLTEGPDNVVPLARPRRNEGPNNVVPFRHREDEGGSIA